MSSSLFDRVLRVDSELRIWPVGAGHDILMGMAGGLAGLLYGVYAFMSIELRSYPI